jgi:hypothetical protein
MAAGERKRFAGLGIPGHGRRQRLQAIGANLGRGQHREHPQARASSVGIKPVDSRMRVRRAKHDRMRQSVKREIVEITPAPGQKALILAPFRPVADPGPHPAHFTPQIRRFPAVSVLRHRLGVQTQARSDGLRHRNAIDGPQPAYNWSS